MKADISGFDDMGTLTAGEPRLAEYCEHKLPTSCRLTSIPECCACADERGHSVAYPTYIDGVGFVQRGTRWQRYCWFCKEFWQNRVQASGLRPGQTRIPEVPDQTEFLKRWYEFYQGYRTVTKDDGSEERVAVLGEEFREVSPGYLPRTLEELRAGRAANDMADQSRHQQIVEGEPDTGPSLEDTLDQMFQAASLEDDQSQPTTRRVDARRSVEPQIHAQSSNRDESSSSNVHAQAMVPMGSRNRDYQVRRVAALRRELHRMRNGIERVITGLRDLGENVPDHTDASGRLTQLSRTLDTIDNTPSHEDAENAINSVNALTNQAESSQSDRTLATIQARVDGARQHVNEARRNRDQAATELDAAEQEFRTSQQRLQQLQREHRTTENYLRLFGTREEMLAQGDQYESPIGGMFTRAVERYRAAEEVRREERTLRRVLEDEAQAGGEEASSRLAELHARERDVWGVPRLQQGRSGPQPESEDDLAQEPRGELEEYYALLRRQGSQQAPQPEPRQPGAEDIADQERAPSPLGADTDNFPRNMLNAVRPGTQVHGGPSPLSTNIEIIAELPASQPEASATEDDRRSDVEHMLLYLPANTELSAGRLITFERRQQLLARHANGALSENDSSDLAYLMDDQDVVWRSGLPAVRLLRQRRAGVRPTLSTVGAPHDATQRTCSAEIMAEAFQMSSEVRRRASNLTAPEQLRMLYRLQAGDRTTNDFATLQGMLDDPETLELATQVHEQTSLGDALNLGDSRQETIDSQRRLAARQGDHSRQELNSQRRATHALALAAGRTAMRAGPATLLEQMADRDEETRVAYERLRQNGFAPEGDNTMARMLRQTMYRPLNLADYGDLETPSESGSDDEEDDAQGLDAKDTGLPEPKSEEDMTISMECRICYTQLAEIACLPCGHLVMCKWCSEQHSPVMAHDRTRPRRAAGCPVCRKGIRQKVRVIRA